MNCPLCETLLEEKADKFYFICGCCGAYVKNKTYYVTPELEEARYLEHNNDVNDPGYQKFTSPITEAVMDNYQAGELGLDYGCGTGPVIAEMLKAKKIKIKLFDPYFYPDTDYLNHQYDFIISCEVFEHFHHPKKEIKKLLSLLKPGGRLFIMTHIYQQHSPFKNWYYRNDPTHVFIYTPKTINYIHKTFALSLEKQLERLVVFKKID